jgi:YbbR domain-containing protein
VNLPVPAIIRRNFRLKALAVGIALVVWTAVVYANNPPDTLSFVVPVQFDSVGTKWALDQPLDPISLRVSGTKDNLAAFDQAKVTARVDVSRITHAGVQDVPVVILNHDPNVTLDNPPSTVRASVDVATTRNVPVTPVTIKTPPPGFLPDPPTVTPGLVTVAGPSKLIDQVKAEVNLDLTGYKTNYNARLPVRLRDASGTVVTSLEVTPATVQVEVVINSSLTSRSVPIIVVVQGQVAPEHILASLTPNPRTVVISGPQTIVNGIDFLEVQVNVSGLFGSVTLPGIAVNTGDPGVSASPDRVDVHIGVLTTPPPTPEPTPTPTPTPAPAPAPTPTPTPTH